MQQVLLWQVIGHQPKRLERGRIDLEKHLEDWIEEDPSLLQDGLTIVGRQVTLVGGTLDLLALDPQGRWVVIEVKRGWVRRKTIAQAVDYASCIVTMPFDQLAEALGAYLQNRGASLDALLAERGAEEDGDNEEREVAMYAVGTGKDPGLDRMVDFLSGFEVPITVVTYDAFETDDGQSILVRELSEAEATPSAKQRMSVEQICERADKGGIGVEFRKLLQAAKKHGIFPRPFTRSIMYTPPWNRANTLFTVQSSPGRGGSVPFYLETGAFAKFYQVTTEEAASLVGAAGWREMGDSDVDNFVAGLDKLFQLIEQHDAESDE
jgi:Holliday junction resolvase-like predicted endonuclease